MENALTYFCELSKKDQESFIACPQLSTEAVSFFTLANAIDCTSQEDLKEWLNGCDFACQHVKAQGLLDYKATEARAIQYYAAEVEKLEDEYEWQSNLANTLTNLTDSISKAKNTWSYNDPKQVEKNYHKKIDETSSLTQDQKNKLKSYVTNTMEKATVFEPVTFNAIEQDFMKEIVDAKSLAERTKSSINKIKKKEGVVKQIGQVAVA